MSQPTTPIEYEENMEIDDYQYYNTTESTDKNIKLLDQGFFNGILFYFTFYYIFVVYSQTNTKTFQTTFHT